MARQIPETPGVLEVPEDQPIIMVGDPANLRGNLYLRNSGSERVMLRTLPFSIPAQKNIQFRSRQPELRPKVRLSPGIIRPGHDGQVSLSLALDPYTPPGEYKAELEIAGKVRPVVMHVTERVSLLISPSQIVVENRPNQKIEKRVIVSNRGNVPLSFGEIGAIFLDDDLLICRTLRSAAAAVGDELRPFEDYLAQIMLSAKHVAESSGILRVDSRDTDFILQPNQTRPVDLEIRVPDGLDKRGRYTGIAALYTASLTIVVVPSSGPTSAELNAETLPRTKKGNNIQKD